MKLTRDAQAWKLVLGLTAAALLLYGASLNDPFHFDDSLIINDSNVTNPGRWLHFFNPLHLRQLTFFSFYLNHLVGGGNPAGYHAVNVLLHAANAVLLAFLVGRFASRWVAIAAATLFLVHPIQTEAVLYIYQRSLLLACFFSLLGAIALAERKTFLAVLFFFLAFEGKESAIAVPVAIALLCQPRETKDRRLRIALVVGAVMLGLFTLGLLAYLQEKTVGLYAAQTGEPFAYLLAQSRVIYTYLRLLVFPIPQSLEYEFSGPFTVFPAIGLLAILVAAVWLSRREEWRVTGLSILGFFILLAPTSSIIPSADLAFEHRLYLPMLAVSIGAANLAAKLPKRTMVGTVVLVLLAFVTVRRGEVWSTDVALWEDAVRKAPGKGRAWFNLGGAYLDAQPEKARTALLRSLELEPNRVEAIYDLGLLEQRTGNYDKALAYYRRASDQNPRYWPAWNNIGNTLFSMGRREESIAYFEKTLSLNRDYWPAHYNLAIVHFLGGRYREAAERLKTVLAWSPDFREARYLMAVTASRSGNPKAAEEIMKELGPLTPAELGLAPPILQDLKRSHP
jgi:Tfp pilus assembly protein PilF